MQLCVSGLWKLVCATINDERTQRVTNITNIICQQLGFRDEGLAKFEWQLHTYKLSCIYIYHAHEIVALQP